MSAETINSVQLKKVLGVTFAFGDYKQFKALKMNEHDKLLVQNKSNVDTIATLKQQVLHLETEANK